MWQYNIYIYADIHDIYLNMQALIKIYVSILFFTTQNFTT